MAFRLAVLMRVLSVLPLVLRYISNIKEKRGVALRVICFHKMNGRNVHLLKTQASSHQNDVSQNPQHEMHATMIWFGG